ncbi:MAG: outer membrane beta-barrel protein, partial [Rikenellaceae bacterium]|nr:outer membrane beta-barrel protein [Rikenellaceae bacterium]
RKGQYGQFSGLYGLGLGVQNRWENYFMGGGYININNNDARVSINAMGNNMNVRHYNENDLLGAVAASGGSGGVAHTANVGVNYNDTWGKKDEVTFSGNYGFNISNTTNERIIDREYFSDSVTQNLYSSLYQVSSSVMRNYNHNLNANIRAKFGDFAQLRVRPSFNYQYNSSAGATTSTYTPTQSIDQLVKEILRSHNDRLSSGWSTGLNATYNQKIGQKAGRALTFNINGSYSRNNGDGNSLSQTSNLPDSVGMNSPYYGDFFKNQNWNQSSYNYNLRGGITYTEPLSKEMSVSANYEVQYRYSDADKRTFIGDWNPADSTWVYSVNFDPQYSNTQNSGYLMNRVGPGFTYSKDGTNITLKVLYQNSTLSGNRIYPKAVNFGRRSFNDVTYSANFRIKIDNQNSVRIRLNSSTSNPSITNLQDVVDISNVQAVSSGNSALKPSYSHNMFTHYIRSNIEKGRTFMIGGGFYITQNSIVNRVVRNSPGYVVYDPVSGQPLTTLSKTATFSSPINMNGDWNVNGMVSYGLPLSFMKCNLNMSANISYRQSPTVTGVLKGVDAQGRQNVEWTTNVSKNLSPGASINLGSNISENVDFTVGYRVNYNHVRNTFNLRNNNDYLNHSAWGNVKVILPLGFTIASNVSYTQNFSLNGSDFNVVYTMWNVSVGKKVFKNNRGEVNLFMNDILDQNRSFQRVWNSLYMQNVTNTSIGRYVGVSLTYNLRNYGSKEERNNARGNFESLRDGGRPQGMPAPPAGMMRGGYGGG